MTTLPPSSDDRLIWDTWLASFRLPAMTVADELGVFGALTQQALTTEALAAELALDARALSILLGALAAMGFVERRDDRWRATAPARTWLDPQADGYYGPMIHAYRSDTTLHGRLLQALKTGARPPGGMSAADEWERGELVPERARMITAFMHSHSRAAAKAVAVQPLFANVRRLLDVGGGSGIFAIELVRVWPQLRASILEIGTICDEAARYIAAAGVAERIDTRALNMFTQEWPAGHDALFFSNIFHDWSDATCALLARKAFGALPSGGRIVLHETLMDDDGCGPYAAAAFSLLMLLGTRGKQYSLGELRGILVGAGFAEVSAIGVGSGYYSLVTARKP
jgi:hypothetical protein